MHRSAGLEQEPFAGLQTRPPEQAPETRPPPISDGDPVTKNRPAVVDRPHDAHAQ
jgi:hypothetical protein